ncbi:MAG TPA: hypothetical protein VGU02_07770 [Gaiellaceae bacterium]|nr:hypothetical protein [Gaiellaceae bacterium]
MELPENALFMVLHGTLLVETDIESYERGAGAVVGYVDEPGARVTALTEARVVVITRADYEAALSG